LLPIPKKIVVAGFNVQGLLAALALRKAYSAHLTSIEVVGHRKICASPSIVIAGQSFTQLLAYFGSQESDWMPRANANFKLTQRFIGWSEKEFCIANKCAVDTLHHPLLVELSKLKRESYDIDFISDKFFLTNYLAEKKLLPYGKDFPFPIEYQYQLANDALLEVLESLAINNGIYISNSAINTLQLDKAGYIKSLECDDKVYSGDYYFDCTGFEQTLISHLHGHEQEKVLMTRKNDRYIGCQMAIDEPVFETQFIALKNGFVDSKMTQNSRELKYYYSSKFCSDDEAAADFKQFLLVNNLNVITDLTLYSSFDHLVKRPWINNCIAIGDSCGFNHLTTDRGIDATLSSLDSFLLSVQQDESSQQAVEQFSSRVKTYYVFLHAFSHSLILLNNRRDTNYWQTPQDINAVHPLVHDIFVKWLKAKDLTTDPVYDCIGLYGWYSLFSGLGHYPVQNKIHPNITSINANIKDVSAKLIGCCLNFPTSSITSMSMKNE